MQRALKAASSAHLVIFVSDSSSNGEDSHPETHLLERQISLEREIRVHFCFSVQPVLHACYSNFSIPPRFYTCFFDSYLTYPWFLRKPNRV